MERPAETKLDPVELADDPIRRAAATDLSRHHSWAMPLIRASLVLVDAAALVVAFWLGYLFRRYFPLFPLVGVTPGFGDYGWMLLVHTTTLLLIFFFARLYHQRRAASRIDTAYAVAASVSVGVVMTSGLATIFLKGISTDYPRQMTLYVWVFSIICVVAGRLLHQQVSVRLRLAGVGRDRVIVVGSGDIAQRIIQQIRQNPELGYTIVGAVNGLETVDVGGIPIIGQPEDLPSLIDNYDVGEVIIALPEASRTELINLVARCQRGQVSIKLYPDLFAYMAGGMSVDELGGMPLLSIRDVALRGWKLSLKRGLDIFGATCGLILLSPFFLLTALLIKLESPGPVFFCQERAGLDNHPFAMIKFRSMRGDAEKGGPSWTKKNDPRITRLGKWMRKANWDEMPNLINVLLGQMSLVGPRPEQTYFVQKFEENIPRYGERHREKSGMTGWAQVNGLRGDTSVEERTKFDLWYVENWSLWLDIKIILRTIVQTALRKSPNAY